MPILKKAFEGHNLLSMVVANMAEGVSVISVTDSTIIYANDKFEKIFGYDHDELTGKHVSILNAPTNITPEDVAQEIINAVENVGMWEGEVKNIKKDGTFFWCYAKVSQFYHEQKGKVWVTVQQDITDRKQLQKQLDERLAQLEDALTKLRLLEGVLRICCSCKKIRDTSDNWQNLEKYITEHSEAIFTHGLCPECSQKYMDDIEELKKNRKDSNKK